MIDQVLDIPNHIRDAFWRVDSARLEARASAGLVVCGMGGSAIGGELARGLLGDRLSGPYSVHRGYGLPSWVSSGWAVLASSYSGDTEETVSSFESAAEIGAHRWVVSTGGGLGARARDNGAGVVGLPGLFEPRMAVGYMTVVAANAAHLAGIAPDLRSELERAADFLDSRKAGLSPLAKELASQIGDTPVVVHGAGLTVSPAKRWATQFNENAKQLAFAAEIPEANHNLIEAWPKGTGGLGAVFLNDSGQTDRERRRMELTAESIEATGAPVFSVETAGETRSERLLWAVMFGDLVSYEVASLRGVDPTPVDQIESFKRRLGKT